MIEKLKEEKLDDDFMLKYKNLFAKIDKNTNDKIIKDTITRLKKEAKKEQEKWDLWQFKEILEDLETSNEIKIFRIKKRIEDIKENLTKNENGTK